ncbi:MAG: biotin/lipoyl-binding protein [Anaerolineae bacterium]|nr:biotin/lipoyl-binding protein [Promineifilum sp.]MCZ2114477.1 biotin/lipoyl-binding protein [Anaerolineae bacterium]HNS40550.1 biotin/lipoyl-binding protein [Promineifilum sp.]
MKYIATVKDREYTIEIDPDRGILIDDVPQEIDFQRLGQSGFLSLLMNHRSVSAVVEEKNDHWDVLIQGELYNVQVQDERVYRLERMRSTGATVDGQAIVTSPMPGIIVAVPVAVGDIVKRGDKVVVLESMKMENELRAPCDGVITHVNVTAGANVEKDQELVGISQEVAEAS